MPFQKCILNSRSDLDISKLLSKEFPALRRSPSQITLKQDDATDRNFSIAITFRQIQIPYLNLFIHTTNKYSCPAYYLH